MTETQRPLQDAASSTLYFDVDPEHTGIRTVGCLSFFITSIMVYFSSASIFPMLGLLNIFIAAIVAVSITYVADLWMKRNWRSGRSLNIGSDRIILQNKGSQERLIHPDLQVNILLWQFKVTRNTRVPKGWHVVACSLQQHDTYLPVYTLMSPDEFTSFELANHFTKLESKKGSGKAENLKLAGLQRRLHDAEADRSLFGAEMHTEQFLTYLNYLQTHYPDWMPTN